MSIANFKFRNESFIAIPFIGFVFILSRMFPLTSLSWLMNGLMVIFFILKIPSVLNELSRSPYVLGGVIVLSIHALYSLFLGNDPVLVVKFYFILVFILISYFCAFKDIRVVNLFLYVVLIQALVVIVIAFFMMIVYRDGNYLEIRAYFLNSGFGDVYTYGNGFYRVQIKGNALLPFSFMISMLLRRATVLNKYKLLSYVFFISCVFAGNFAFYISIFIFFVINFFNLSIGMNANKKMKFFYSLILFLMFFSFATPFIIDYVNTTLEMKSLGNSSSLGVRYEQFNLLIDDMLRTWYKLTFGSGLGNVLNVRTATRDYSSNVYYELQTIYFLNQMGFLIFFFYLIINFLLAISYIKEKTLLFVYASYVLYAVTNPYMLDSNQVAIIIILVTLSKLGILNSDNLIKKHTE